MQTFSNRQILKSILRIFNRVSIMRFFNLFGFSKANTHRSSRFYRSHIGSDQIRLEDRQLLSATPLVSKIKHPSLIAQNNLSKKPQSPTPKRWQWLQNTYWIVPNPNLTAIQFNPSTGQLSPILDQTVYHISGYRNGYFWGETVAQYGSAAPVSSMLLGSVTPEGNLLLNFDNGNSTITGIGKMTLKNGRWAMENQMFTSTKSEVIGHWAYMIQAKPGTRNWKSLPFVHQSVPEFMSNYDLPIPTPGV